MKPLDRSKPFTQVGGRLPVVYMQDGVGFNGKGDPLGAVNTVGELLPEVDDERSDLEKQAEVLGVKFRSTLSTEKLRERVDAARSGVTQDDPDDVS